MSHTQSLSRRYNHMQNRASKNSKPPTVRLTTSQLLGSKLFSLEVPQNSSNFIIKNRDHTHSQSRNNPSQKSQRKTQSVLSRKKTMLSGNKKILNSKTTSKNHSRLQSEATTTIKNEAILSLDLKAIYDRTSTILMKYKTKQQQWKKQKQNYEITIQKLLQKIKKSNKNK